MKNFEASDIEYLYKKCNGSPKILSTVISKLLEKDGITIRNNIKANIDKKMLFSILQSEYIQFDASDFTTAQKWIIFSYLCLNEKTDVQMLEDLGLFIASKIYLLKTYNKITFYKELQASVNKGYKRDKIEMRGDRAEISDFPLYLNTVAGGLDRRDQTIGGFSFVVKIYALPVVEIIGQLLYLLGRYGFNAQFGDCL